MTSEMILESDKRQSVSQADVEYFAKKGIVLQAGIACEVNPDHGRMLMSAKTGLLECWRGGCNFQAVALKD